MARAFKGRLGSVLRQALFAIAFATCGFVFLTVAGDASADPAPERILNVDQATSLDYVDPALAFFLPSWQAEQATCARLVNYGDEPGLQGKRLRPEVAEAMPTVSADGRTYTFQLRDSFHFSPPAAGDLLRPFDYKKTFERLLNKDTVSPAQPFYSDIVGAKDVIAGLTNEISGIVAGEHTLSFTLEQPASDLLARLAMPFACPLPAGTAISPNGMPAPVPSAGPYYIAQYTTAANMLLLRNPNYGGSRPQRFDEIRYRFGAPLETTRQDIIAGTVDYGQVAPDVQQELAQQYGPGSANALTGHQQWFSNPIVSFRYLAFNHERPLFGPIGSPLGNVNLKKAVNYVVDRSAIAAVYGYGAGDPHDQYLTQGFPGYQEASIYPNTPDVPTARALAGWSPGDPVRPAVMYTCTTAQCLSVANIVKVNLANIGLDVQIQAFPRAIQFERAGTRGEPFDITYESWFPSYFDPGNVLFLLDGRTIKPANNTDFSYFNDAAYIAKFQAASELSGAAREQAFGLLDLETARDKAPLASLMSNNVREFFSRRIGCQQIGPQEAFVRLVTLCIRPAIEVNDRAASESDASMSFTVSLSSEEDDPLLVDYATADGTATAGQDYTATSGTLTFAAHERTKTVTVNLIDDDNPEAAEFFELRLSSATKGTIVDAGGRAEIAASDDGGTPPPPGPPPPGPPPPGPPSPPSPPPPGPGRTPQASISSAPVVVSGGVAPVSLNCTGSVACKGGAELYSSFANLELAKRVKIASARFAIAAHKKGTIKLRLNRRGKQLIRATKRVRVQLVVTLNRARAKPKVIRKTITLVGRSR